MPATDKTTPLLQRSSLAHDRSPMANGQSLWYCDSRVSRTWDYFFYELFPKRGTCTDQLYCGFAEYTFAAWFFCHLGGNPGACLRYREAGRVSFDICDTVSQEVYNSTEHILANWATSTKRELPSTRIPGKLTLAVSYFEGLKLGTSNRGGDVSTPSKVVIRSSAINLFLGGGSSVWVPLWSFVGLQRERVVSHVFIGALPTFALR